MHADLPSGRPVAREGYITVKNAQLYYREAGQGRPIIVLHGGPDFDHSYLLPDMDRLAGSYRLIYYAQRGRGKSSDATPPGPVTMASEIQDLEELREHFQLDRFAVLGHSWGGLLALEYALAHPNRLSHLLLMGPAPASHQDYRLFREELRVRRAGVQAAMNALISSAGYQEGDPDAVAEYYRLHFGTTVRRAEHLESVLAGMGSSFTRESIMRGRAIEDGLVEETWLSPEFDLLPSLKGLNIPTLVMHGGNDFIPVACAEHIAHAIPGARFVLIKESGHFAYIEAPDAVHQQIADFFGE